MSFKKYTSLEHPFEYDTIYEYNTHYDDYEKYDEEEYYIDEECYDDSINPNEFQVDETYIWMEERSNDLDMHLPYFNASSLLRNVIRLMECTMKNLNKNIL